MTAQHFREILESVLLTKRVSKAYLCREIGITKTMINLFEKNGLPISSIHVIYKIREFAVS